jgi:hypothetical protein
MSVLLLIVVAALLAAVVMVRTNRPAPSRVPVRVVRSRMMRRR